MALSDERSSTGAWERGAVGEERVAAILAKLDPARVTLLHDRRIPGSRQYRSHRGDRRGIWGDRRQTPAARKNQSVRGCSGPRAEAVRRLADCTSLVDGVLLRPHRSKPRWLTSPVHPVLFRRLRLGSVGRTDQISGVSVTTRAG